MNPLSLFAHDGHDHDVAESVTPISTSDPWWTSELALNGFIILGFIGLMVLTTYVIKLKPATRLIIAMAYLLVVGVLAYKFSPVLSIVSLAVGMGLALTTTLFQLGKPHEQK